MKKGRKGGGKWDREQGVGKEKIRRRREEEGNMKKCEKLRKRVGEGTDF